MVGGDGTTRGVGPVGVESAAVRIGVGSPAEEIFTAAEDMNVSLVAMSSHGEDWMKELIIGSLAYEVSKNGTRPVLVLRAGRES